MSASGRTALDGTNDGHAALARRDSVLLPPNWELALLGGLCGAYFVGREIGGADITGFINLIGPICLVAALGLSGLRMALLDANAIWTALFWFRMSASVYYGVGNLVPVFGGERTRSYLQAFYPFSDSDLSKVNMLVAVACFVVVAAAKLSLHDSWRARAPENATPVNADPEGKGLLSVGLLFLTVGGLAKYLFIVPSMFNLSTFVVPGAIGSLGSFDYAAVYLLTVWSRLYRPRVLPLVVAYVLVDMLLGIMAFTKYEVLILLILFLFGFLTPRVTVTRLTLMAAILVFSYISLAPIITIGRGELYARYAYGQVEESDAGLKAGFAERIEIIRNAWFLVGQVQEFGDGASPALARLSYVNQATYAVQRFDKGQPGNSLDNALAVFVPRLFWAGKPIITQVAIEFNYAVTGNPFSSSSPGLFADAYWNLGWPGVFVLMSLLGIVLGLLSRLSLRMLSEGRWLFFPIVLLAMKIGFRTDGYLVADILGPFVILGGSYVVIWIGEQLYQLLRTHPRVARA